MRGADITQESLFTVAKLDDFVPADHPLRVVRTLVDTALKRLDGLFSTLYSDYGRASIAPEKLMRAQLSYQGHILMENRHGLVRDACLSLANGHGERDSALTMMGRLKGRRRRTLAADKAYDTADFVAGCRDLGVTAHVAQNTTNRRSAIDGRTTRHNGYAVSIKIRAWIETHFGWTKSAAGLRQVKQRGHDRVEPLFQMAMVASNLIRLRGLLAAELGA
ncbi:MAG: transposase [Salinisphaera sp.]|nr:transposase [Salinisphaera sp.]